MFKRKSLLLATILALVTLVGVAGCTPADLQALQGTLKNVDSASGNVTVTLKDGTTKTFNFSDVKVATIAQALGGASLQVGDQVTIKANTDGNVEEVDSPNAQIEGTIKSVGTNSITVTTTQNADIILNITTNTTIRIGDKVTTLSNLTAGQNVVVRYDASTKNAIRINVAVGKTVEETRAIVKAINTSNKTVTLKIQQKDVTLNITADTVIRIGDKGTASLSDLTVGQQVEVRYDTSNNTAIRINMAVGETVGDVLGTIKGVDTTNKTVTITTKRQGDITLNITPDAIIRIGDKGTASLSDLTSGQKVEAKYSLTTKNALRINIDNGGNGNQNNQQGGNNQKGK